MLAVRVPSHPVALALLRALGKPLAAPSANPFGYISPTRPQHVLQQLGGRIPYILDGGPSKVGIESTIVSVENGVCIIYRYGGLSIEDIKKVLPGHTFLTAKHAEKILPGTLARHYSPNRHLILVPSRIELEEMAPDRHDCFVIAFKTPIPRFDLARQRVLSPEGNMAEAASNLFASLHEADAMPGVKTILVEPAPGEGIGLAINDRLQRAAAQKEPEKG
jgi:L-threonylcarbamoyladenylate synthase